MLIRPSFRRNTLSRLSRLLAIFLILWTIVDVFTIQLAITQEASTISKPLGTEKIFIASIHWTDELVLRTHWISAVLNLAQTLGRDKVFVSVYESGSLDDTKGALRSFHQSLEDAGIRGKVLLDETTREDVTNRDPADSGWIQMPRDKWVHADEVEWLMVPKGKWVPRRIPYLASLRNVVLEPLYELRKSGESFDRILFLNDVVFDVADVQRLLDTRNGDYAAACSLDFKTPPTVYDSFALRDLEGHEPITGRWPYFRSHESRDAVKRAQAVPVSSCWNGMVAMDATPFYAEKDPLTFRGISDSLSLEHMEGSECCLIHADNPCSQTKGVWVNPNVRVGYNGSAYETVNPPGGRSWLSVWAVVVGLWQNRLLRWTTRVWAVDRSIAKRLAGWREEHSGEEEFGETCLVSEMQVLLWNGWAHV